MMLRRLAFALCLALYAPAAHAAPIKVVATNSIIADLVARVGGDRIELTTLVGPNMNTHAFQPTPETVKAMENADMVVVNGISYEGWMGRLIVSSGYSGPVVVAAREITALTINDQLELDPHAWLSVSNTIRYVANIRDGLIEEDRGHSAKYKENAELYIRQLQTLESWIKTQIAAVPEDKRMAVTPHSSFQYFGRYYGIRFLSPMGTTNDDTPSAASLARLIDLMRKDQIRAVFQENLGENQVIKQLQQDTGAYLGGVLYADALSLPSGPAPDYISLMRHNVKQLVEGMQHNGPLTATTPTLQLPDDSTFISID